MCPNKGSYPSPQSQIAKTLNKGLGGMAMKMENNHDEKWQRESMK